MKIPAKLIQSYTDVAAMLAFLYSPEAIEVFTEMATDDFAIGWEELTPEEAHALLTLLTIGSTVLSEVDKSPERFGLMPILVVRAFRNACLKLAPYKDLLQRVFEKQLSPFEAKILGRDLSLHQGEGIRMTMDQLNNRLVNAA